MKSVLKVFGIIALVAVIGFSFAACGGGDGNGDNDTYVSKDAGYTYELSFIKTDRTANTKGGDKYMFSVSDDKTKIASRSGTVKIEGDTITLTPPDSDSAEITVSIKDDELRNIKGRVRTKNDKDFYLPGGVSRTGISVLSGDFWYKTGQDGKAIITRYIGDGGAVTIPETIDDKPVTGIGNGAFQFREDITGVTIPDGVTVIGDGAFWVTGLTAVTIPNNVTVIGEMAFYYCKIISLTIPNSVKTIGEWAFGSCLSLTSISIGSGVTSIGYQAFGYSENLATITVASENTAFSSQNGILYNKTKTILIQCPTKITGAITIPGSVTNIGTFAFRSCKNITSLTIENGVTNIGDNAFFECSGITGGITIPDSVKNTGQMAFASCSNITSLTIGNGLTRIENGAFYYCEKLASVTIGNSVKSIGIGAFRKCAITTLTIPNNVTRIENGAFHYCTKLTSVTIGSGVTSIERNAFEWCNSLTSVTFATGSNIADANFEPQVFPEGEGLGFGGDTLKTAYRTGKAGTYTRSSNGTTWTKQ